MKTLKASFNTSGFANSEEAFTFALANDIQREIDWSVLVAVMKTASPTIREWTEVKFSEYAMSAGEEEIKLWAEEHLDNGFFLFYNRIMIATEEDVVKFMLRWA